MISYKVIALILEPYRNATSSQAAIKKSETTNPQPDHLENVDVEYESFEQYEEEFKGKPELQALTKVRNWSLTLL